MMEDNKADTDAQRWREKYFSASEALDEKEQEHANYLHVLHRALVRISLAADGQDNELDKHLADLRKLLRKEPVHQPSINSNLAQVETAILQMDEQHKQGGEQGFTSLQALVNQLLQLNLSKEKQRTLKQYGKSLAAKTSELSSYPALLEQYRRLQGEALTEALGHPGEVQNAPASEPGGGFLVRVFGAKKEQPNAVENDISLETDPVENHQDQANPTRQAPIEPDASAPNTRADSGQGDELATIIKTLADLLEQLPLPPETRDQAEQLRDHLTELADAGQLDQMIDGTAELVIKALDKSQLEFEQFLLALDQQLSHITRYLASQGQNSGARIDATDQINSVVRGQVGNLSKSLEEASDIHELKDSVQSQLESIVVAMDDFVETETQREQALEQQLQEMQDQLMLAQTESQAMRRKLQNETLRALTDTLTHLPNREAFDERFQLERERFLRYKHPASVAMLDLDHFKRVNDNHGHLVGDRVLQAFGETIKNMIRTTDFLARFGGEEFILIMPHTELSAAQVLLEKIRVAISDMPPKGLGIESPITVSSGIAEFQLGEKAEQLLERADKALYLAKAKGRNTVMLADNTD